MSLQPSPTTPPESMNFLITGAARGIGRGLTHSLLSRGHRVFLLDNNAAELQQTLTLTSNITQPSSHQPKDPNTETSSPRFNSAIVDLADRTAVKKVIGEVDTFFNGKLDVLINNAMALPHTWTRDRGMEDGAQDPENEDSILAEWDAKLAVGLTAPFLLSRLCVRLLSRSAGTGDTDTGDRDTVAGGAEAGSIINISSTRWSQSEPNHEAYSAAKAGLQGLTQSMATSLGPRHGIRVNSISPGWVHVGEQNLRGDEEGVAWGDGLSEEDHRWHLVGRVGRVADVERAVLFLAESGFVTGQDVVVDGGVGRKMVYPE